MMKAGVVLDSKPAETMTSTIGGSRTRVPASAQLNAWAAREWVDGVVIDELSPHDRLIVRTRNSTYEIIVAVPHTAEVLVRGGAFFPDFTPAHVAGSSLGGAFLKLHGIYARFQLEIAAKGQPVVTTTRVRHVTVVPARDGEVM
jgi:hypothetical protein